MEQTRDHILKEASGLFLRDSFKGVTLSQLLKKTGLSKGAFYHYFESKEQLFEEILNSYFLNSMAHNYSEYSKDSLYQFGRDYLAESKAKHRRIGEGRSPSSEHENYYFLIFEGMKVFPEFRRKLMQSQEAELNAWKAIVGIARKKGEIKSNMTDDQIAKLFIFITDGVGERLIMGSKISGMVEEVKSLWDGLYQQLKA
jgi:TetR/AcrR family transcriptional regulator, transcriptional repressor for nem operon